MSEQEAIRITINRIEREIADIDRLKENVKNTPTVDIQGQGHKRLLLGGFDISREEWLKAIENLKGLLDETV